MRRHLSFFIGLCFLFVFSFGFSIQNCQAVASDGFVMNVILDDKPVNEIIGNEVAVPFDSEYKLRLKNNNDRRCTVRITIDGAQVSSLGDIILRANDEIDLERFVDRSLEEGKRFKFVPLDNPEVDDPSRKENGEIVAEFRLEKERGAIIIEPEYFVPPEWSSKLLDTSSFCSATVNCSASVQPGATIGGSDSYQRFVRTDIDVEDMVHKLTLKMVGLQG